MASFPKITLALCAAWVCLGGGVQAQQKFPSKPIRLLVGASPGGGASFVARGLSNAGAEPSNTTTEQYTAFVQSEFAKWNKVIKAAGIKGQ